MKFISLDPGAERLGWSAFENRQPIPKYLASGVLRLPRAGAKFQMYRLHLNQVSVEQALNLIEEYAPDVIVNETVPAVGGGNFVVATQSYLANVAVTVFHTIAYICDIRVEQIGATTIKKNIGGSNKATKVKVRNGVIQCYPELQPRKSDWVKEFDEPDAIATGLAWAGVKV